MSTLLVLPPMEKGKGIEAFTLPLRSVIQQSEHLQKYS